MEGKEALQQRLERLTRLRELGLQRGARGLIRVSPVVPPAERTPLPGQAVETPFGPAWVRTVRFPLAERPDLAELLTVEPDVLAALAQDPALKALEPARAAFIDTETTSLATDTSTYTFMIGIGTYELRDARAGCGAEELVSGPAFVVRQFFMRNPAEERGQLHLVEEALGPCTGLVTFNGRAFDLPLLQNRFTLACMPMPLAGAPHLDLLPPARRIWRVRLASCRLASLEQQVLGLQRSAEDVPSWLIPEVYRDYCRTGLVSDLLVRVFYHNLADVCAMPLLAARMARLFRLPNLKAEIGRSHPLECLSLARCYEALGWAEAGVEACRAALAGELGGADRVRVLSHLGFLLKRLGRLEAAAEVWEELIRSTPDPGLTPYVELAKYHEWQTGDLAAAHDWAARAWKMVEGWPPGPARSAAQAELQHRLARLARKLPPGGTVTP